MGFESCLADLPKINWHAVNKENDRYYRQSYWCVTHYETNRVWRRRSCWDSTCHWDKTHPIRGFDNADRVRRNISSGDRGLWKLREVSQYELENMCTNDGNGHYKFKDLKYPA